MTLLAPWWLLGWLLVPVLFVWGLLAPRGRRVTVGSLLLWRRALGEGAVGRPSARLRLRDPLVWLDASAVFFIVLACARPAFRTEEPVDPVATVVVDRSASMGLPSLGGGDVRWKAAHRLLAAALDGAGDAPLRLVEVPGPEGVVRAEEVPADEVAGASGYRPSDGAWPASGPANASAGEVAGAEAARRLGRPVLLVTDVAPNEPLPKNVFVLAPGGTSVNAGLVRVATRGRTGEANGAGGWVLIEGRAADGAPGPYDLTVTDEADPPKVLERLEDVLRPGESLARVLEVEGPGPLRVRLEGPDDGFAPDDAVRVAWPEPDRIDVRCVGACEASLVKALEAAANVRVALVAPPTAEALAGADVVVVCGGVVPAGWPGAAVLVGPEEAVGPIRPTDERVPAEWRVAADHPLAEALYLPAPRVGTVRRYQLYSRAGVLAGTAAAPLIVTWSANDARRMAVLMDISGDGTDWPRRAGFPVFWSRAMAWLAGRNDAAEAPGEGGVPSMVLASGEGFEAGPGRDASPAAREAVLASAAAGREASLASAWPYAAAVALVALAARAWVAR